MWPDEVLQDRAPAIAGALLALLSAGPRWRHRRVETIAPLSATTVERRVSVDFTVPDFVHGDLALPGGSRTQWLVPLGWLARRQLVAFDLRDAEAQALPLLLAGQTALLTRDLLVAAALRGGLEPGGGEATDAALAVIERAAGADPVADAAAVERAAAGLGLGPEFEGLVRSSLRGFLLFALLSEVRGRQVVKWQTVELRRAPASRLARPAVAVEVPGLNEAESTHVEVALPDVLRAEPLRLFDRRADGLAPLPAGERAVSHHRERPRLLLQPVREAREPVVRADLLLVGSHFLWPALTLAALAVVIVVAGLAGHVEALGPDDPTTAPAILLGAFSVGFGLFLRTEDNPLVRDLLTPARAALGAVAGAVAMAAIPIAFHLPREWILGAWIGALVVAAAALLVVGWVGANLTEPGRRSA